MAKTPFEGRLRDAVNGAHGARPFAYEISIATHLMQKGWDVEFVDYSGAARFDFLARQDTVEVEIECKTTSNDTGRKIYRQEVNCLADLLLPMRELLADRQGCHCILVTVPDRLAKSNDELYAITSCVEAAVKSVGSVSTVSARAEYTFETLETWPEPDRDLDAAIAFFEGRFGRQNAHLVFHERRGFSIVAIMVTSAKGDGVIDTISQQAKEAAGQCSGTRPAMIALHLVDQLSRDDLQSMLRTSKGLHTITHAVFQNENRLHADSIAFTVPQVRRSDRSGARWLSGDLVMLNNPSRSLCMPRVAFYLSRRCVRGVSVFHRPYDTRSGQPMPEREGLLVEELLHYGLIRQQTWALIRAAPPEVARCMNLIWGWQLQFHPQTVFTIGGALACRARFCQVRCAPNSRMGRYNKSPVRSWARFRSAQ